MATEDSLQNFMANLKELETVATARQYVPKDRTTYTDLQDTIVGHSRSLKSSYDKLSGEGGAGKSERSRLEGLYNLLKDIPSAQKVVRSILFLGIQKKVEHQAQEDPSNKAVLAQKSILDIWQTLQSEKIDNNVVEDVVLKALASHGRTLDDPLNHPAQNKLVKSEKEEETLPSPWFILIDGIIFPWPNRIFEDVRLDLVDGPINGTLTLCVSGETVGDNDPKSHFWIGSLRYITHSASKIHIRLDLDSHTLGIIDVRVQNTLDGQRLIDKLRDTYHCRTWSR
ncbi:MAG: hypothetical protein Q9201_002710 [Fulgogasparrea decipioides]